MDKKIELSRFGRRRKPNHKRSLVLILALLLIIFLYLFAEDWIINLFS